MLSKSWKNYSEGVRMSRLYTWLNTDTLKTTHTARGNQETHFKVNFGSKGNSQPLLEVSIFYRNGEDKPTVTILNHLEGSQ
jgi:hypothetical protein